MTRKDFELIANALRIARQANQQPAHGLGIDDAAFILARDLATTNPNFDRARFLKACGVDGVY